MGVDHGGVYISVPHQLLDRADVLSTLQQMGSEGVTEGMRRGGLMDAARQRLGHQHAPPARRQVILMQVAHRELPPLEVQILHSQSQGFHQSQPLLVAHPFPQRQSSAGVVWAVRLRLSKRQRLRPLARAMWAWG